MKRIGKCGRNNVKWWKDMENVEERQIESWKDMENMKKNQVE